MQQDTQRNKAYERDDREAYLQQIRAQFGQNYGTQDHRDRNNYGKFSYEAEDAEAEDYALAGFEHRFRIRLLVGIFLLIAFFSMHELGYDWKLVSEESIVKAVSTDLNTENATEVFHEIEKMIP